MFREAWLLSKHLHALFRSDKYICRLLGSIVRNLIRSHLWGGSNALTHFGLRRKDLNSVSRITRKQEGYRRTKRMVEAGAVDEIVSWSYLRQVSIRPQKS